MDVLEEFCGKSNNGVPKLASWDWLLDTDLGGDPTAVSHRTLKDVIHERMIRLFSDTTLALRGSLCIPKVGCSYSAIFVWTTGNSKDNYM
jgi:hypothetical protein